MRAFIFSLDAFVAFTLALVVIYSLIFFSSVPSAYYHLLTQGHYLTRDVLYSLSTTQCSLLYNGCDNLDTSILDNIAFSPDITPISTTNLIKDTAGTMVPNQFGYIIEVSKDKGQTWITKYNTSAVVDPHADSSKKLQISTVIMAFNYPSTIKKLDYSPYNYMTCGFGSGWEEGQVVPGSGGSIWTDLGIITCGELSAPGGSPGGAGGYIIGNHPPEETLGGELVPSTDVRLVRFTIYI